MKMVICHKFKVNDQDLCENKILFSSRKKKNAIVNCCFGKKCTKKAIRSSNKLIRTDQ